MAGQNRNINRKISQDSLTCNPYVVIDANGFLPEAVKKLTRSARNCKLGSDPLDTLHVE